MAESRIKDENYRKKYKEYYGIDFDKTFDVHHIDLDRNNNEIDNLILLPKNLHEQYHKCLAEISGITDISKLKVINVKNGGQFEHEALLRFCVVMSEIAVWKAHKANLEYMRSVKYGRNRTVSE